MQNVMSLQRKYQWQTELGRFVRFLVVGASGTLLDFAILTLIKHFLGWPTLPANVISYSCGIISNFVLTQWWVYRDAGNKQTFVQLAQFALVSLIGLILNNVLVLALEVPAGNLLHSPANGYLPAKLAATLIVLLWNFFANRFWTFNRVANHKQDFEQ